MKLSAYVVLPALLSALLLTGGGSRAVATPAAGAAVDRPQTTPVVVARAGRARPQQVLDADVDGDGLTDQVILGPIDYSDYPSGPTSERLGVIRGGSGKHVFRTLDGVYCLGGLAHDGTGRRVIVMPGTQARTKAFGLGPHGLVALRLPTRGSIWVDDRDRLLHAVSNGGTGQPTRVLLRRGTRLVPGRPAGLYCSRTGQDPHPHPCPGNTSPGSFDVGPHGDLPALFPADDRPVEQSADIPGGRAVIYQALGPPHSPSAAFQLSVDYGEDRSSVDLPDRPFPALHPVVLRSADGEAGGLAPFALVVERQEGSTALLDIYRPHGNRLDVVRIIGQGQLGGASYTTWLSQDGVLYTRLPRAGKDHFQVWSWALKGEHIRRTSLGVVCVDDTAYPPAYGTC